ncbi:MAG: sulfatase-like hydrolase/transferase, partial [Planctomycetaceae bacterium]|nr:sulfatase-like hydrolase/transferase [Planctomycetaceae bacterium]
PYFTKHFTDANGDFALEMIERLSKDERPFFLNVWWLVPHKPYEPAPGPHWGATAAPDISEDQHRFRSMVRHMDARIGDLMRRLEQLGIADNTLVIFTSDNGAAFEGYIGELKGGKTDLHEGGIRVPLLAWWPGHIKAGQTSEAFLHSNDWLPTFCEAAGVEVPAAAQVDGRSVLAHLLGGEAPTWEQRGDVHW